MAAAVHSDVANFPEESRRQIVGWLANTNDVLPETCGALFALVYGPILPGKAMLMAHCIRELRNGLVAYYVGIGGQRLEYKDEVNVVAQEWDRAALVLPAVGLMTSAAPAATPPAPNLAVPLSLVVAFRGLIEKHRSVTLTNRERTEQLFAALQLGTGVDGHIFKQNVDRWHALVEWFVGKVHTRTTTDRDLLNDEYYGNLRQFFESLLTFARSPAFVAGLEEIDAILDEANRSAD